jgi:hypothetical protein
LWLLHMARRGVLVGEAEDEAKAIDAGQEKEAAALRQMHLSGYRPSHGLAI